MKSIDEISRLSAEDLERIALDESIPVPEELSGKVQEALARADANARTRRLRWILPSTGIAAAAAILLAVGLTRNPEPKDTFDDPYLAYAEVERVFSKISGTVAYGAEKVSQSEQTLDKITYWK